MEHPALKGGPVQLGEGLDGVLRDDVGDEGEPFDLPGVSVDGQVDLGQGAEGLEQLFQFVLLGGVGQVADKQPPGLGNRLLVLQPLRLRLPSGQTKKKRKIAIYYIYKIESLKLGRRVCENSSA